MASDFFLAATRWSLRRTITVIVLVVPWLIRLLILGMWGGLITAVALCNGDSLSEHCKKLADIWTRRAIEEGGLPAEFERRVRSIFEVIAWLVTFAGIIFLAHLTVFIWGVIW